MCFFRRLTRDSWHCPLRRRFTLALALELESGIISTLTLELGKSGGPHEAIIDWRLATLPTALPTPDASDCEATQCCGRVMCSVHHWVGQADLMMKRTAKIGRNRTVASHQLLPRSPLPHRGDNTRQLGQMYIGECRSLLAERMRERLSRWSDLPPVLREQAFEACVWRVEHWLEGRRKIREAMNIVQTLWMVDLAGW